MNFLKKLFRKKKEDISLIFSKLGIAKDADYDTKVKALSECSMKRDHNIRNMAKWDISSLNNSIDEYTNLLNSKSLENPSIFYELIREKLAQLKKAREIVRGANPE